MATIRTRERKRPREGQSAVAHQVLFRVGGKQTSETFDDRRIAERFAKLIDDVGPAEALEVLAEWDQVETVERAQTVSAWATEHVEGMSGVGAGYRDKCRAYIRNDFTTIADLPLQALTPERVAKWVNALEKSGQSGKTIRNKHGFLSAVMRHAVRAGLTDSNPCEGTRLPRTVSEPMTFLTPEEYADFLGYFTPAWQPLVATLFGTGARFSEATALTVADVDLNSGAISITKAWKDNGKRIGPPKSRRSVRTLSLAPETVEILRPLVEGAPGDRLLFTNALGKAVRLQTFHDNAWQPAVRLANGEPGQAPGATAKRVSRRRDASGKVIEPAKVALGKRPRVHDARHSCASWLLAAGAPLNVVQAHMGHESITTTTSVYGHLLPSARSAVANALSAALSPAHPKQIDS